MKRTIFGPAIWSLCIVVGFLLVAIEVWASSLTVDPPKINVRESFQGQPITVSAMIPQEAGAVVELTGHSRDLVLLRQGQRGGLWMSVGEVKIGNCPSSYFLMTTPDLKSSMDIEKQFGYGILKKRLTFQGAIPRGGADYLFPELIKLKEHEGLFGIFPGSLEKLDFSNGQARIRGQIFMPSDIAAGVYRVSLFVLNSGHVVEQQRVDLPVEMRGMPALLASLAHEHATLYGLLAVFIAIMTGFLMGFIFKGRSAH